MRVCVCLCIFGSACLCVYVFVCAWRVEVRLNYNDHDSSAIISLQKQGKKDYFECGSSTRVERVREEVKVEEGGDG